MIKIATWNVNSIRARLPRVFEWIKEENPDIILLQELKCTEDQFPLFEFATEFNYNIEMVCEKARNGVAILSKFPLYNVQKNLPLYDIVEKDESTRYIEANFDYNNKGIGEISKKLYDTLVGIQMGKIEAPEGWIKVIE